MPAPITPEELSRACHCGDEQAAQVAALMEAGWTQREASLHVYSGIPLTNEPPAWDAGRAPWTAWVAGYVRAVVKPLAEAVGL